MGYTIALLFGVPIVIFFWVFIYGVIKAQIKKNKEDK